MHKYSRTKQCQEIGHHMSSLKSEVLSMCYDNHLNTCGYSYYCLLSLMYIINIFAGYHNCQEIIAQREKCLAAIWLIILSTCIHLLKWR